ncbi:MULTISPECIES: hypothetical protein [Actinomadura]|uniref:Uncharacterized protein n=1 Tax=Actinomadura litoris TaxID=2678616 RepID=A0A7K1KYN1_9ACTN|nr:MULTISPECIES: hypothetical protein [Actinomadura]MBT2212174.1 hypothetical protein [Actinomadura sp. NEAU-AAG7]MUN37330.1 hypothetical protein [Actinomadura litoris]
MTAETQHATHAGAVDAAQEAMGCTAYSWSPEVHDLYGDPETIIRKMDGMDMELADRRIFVLLTESANGADIRFFERVGDGEYVVSTWSGDAAAGLVGRLADTILGNKGVHCVGEQVRAMLSEYDLEPIGTVPAPANARAAFAHTVRGHGEGTFTRATAALLC